MNLEDIFDKMHYSPSMAFDRGLRKKLMPQLASAISGRTQAGIRANAATDVASLGAGVTREGNKFQFDADKYKTDVQDTGKTHRTMLTNASNEALRGIIESGLNRRQERGADLADYLGSNSDRRQEGILDRFGGNVNKSSNTYDEESIRELVSSRLLEQQKAAARKKKKEDYQPDIYYDTEIYTPAQ